MNSVVRSSRAKKYIQERQFQLIAQQSRTAIDDGAIYRLMSIKLGAHAYVL